MKILLTGATGFVGSQLAKRLVAKGYELTVLVRLGSSLDVLDSILEQIKVHRHDGSYTDLLAALQAAQPEIVIHVASLFLAQHKPEDVGRLVESNINFPTQLLEAMSQQGIRQFINTGTSWQHYQNEAYSPVNLYAASKQAFEAMLAYYTEAQAFKAITLKLFDTYGPGDTRPKLFSLLRKAARSGETLRMSPGEQQIDLVYIDDVLDAFELAIERVSHVTEAECYAISNLQRLSLRELVAVYSAAVGKTINVEWGGLPYRPREVMEPWMDYALVPGWCAKTILRAGIMRMERDAAVGGLLVDGE